MFVARMQQPSIVFTNFTFYEPVTSITDFLICIFCSVLAFKLLKIRSTYWSIFYFLLAISALLGAFGHALFAYKDNILKLYSRIMMVFATLFAIFASTILLNKIFIKVTSFILSIFLFAAAIYFLLKTNDFEVVKWYNAIGFVFFISVIQIFNIYKKKEGSKLILGGIIIIIIAGIIHSMGISFNVWFNKNEIAHSLSIIALLIIYKGIFISTTNEESKYETI
ncbi:MAG: hypothetical protein HUU47_08715 [Bacteroidetes bacterium]|nr:hypothetical protein [Bacteroidota bacterium]